MTNNKFPPAHLVEERYENHPSRLEEAHHDPDLDRDAILHIGDSYTCDYCGARAFGGSSTLSAEELKGDKVIGRLVDFFTSEANTYWTLSSLSASGMNPVRSGALSCLKGSLSL